MEYANIYSQIWKDKKIKKLSPEGKVCFIYTFTNSSVTPSGIYNFDPEVARVETGLKNSKFKKAFKEIIDNGLIKWDEEENLIWVVNKFKYTPKSPTIIRSIVRELIQSEHSFSKEFLKKYYDYFEGHLPPNYKRKSMV